MIRENIRLALIALRTNKLRSLLTMLGIIIGIASVITIITIGDAITGSINAEWAGYGARNVTVSIGDRSAASIDQTVDPDHEWAEPQEKDLMTEDMISDYQRRFAGEIEAVAVADSLGTAPIADGRFKSNLELVSSNPGARDLDKVTLAAGSFLTAADLRERKPAVVVSDRFVKEIFGGRLTDRQAVGKSFLAAIDRNPVRLYIQGVYAWKPSDGAAAYSRDSGTRGYVPYTYVFQVQQKKVGFRNLTIIPSEKSEPREFLLRTTEYFSSYYMQNDRIDASVRSMASMLKSMNRMLDQVKLGIGGVAAISLLVGGIGVMNIMMVSVTERTREIGIRMALGARDSMIRLQFLTEAMIISMVGGMIGVILGLGLGTAISSAMHYQAHPSLAAILGSVMFAMLIGIFFGYAPADKASKLDPIEALRYE